MEEGYQPIHHLVCGFAHLSSKNQRLYPLSQIIPITPGFEHIGEAQTPTEHRGLHRSIAYIGMPKYCFQHQWIVDSHLMLDYISAAWAVQIKGITVTRIIQGKI